MSKASNPFDAIRSAGGGTRAAQATVKAQPATGQTAASVVPPSRAGTVLVAGHFPRAVRDQLKILAVEQGKTVQSMQAEALNDLFAKYGKPEIAPTKED